MRLPQTQKEFNARNNPRPSDYKYVCAQCGERFTHYWRGVQRAEYIFFPSSLLRHAEMMQHDIFTEEMHRGRDARRAAREAEDAQLLQDAEL